MPNYVKYFKQGILKMLTMTNHKWTARQSILEFACEVALYRVNGGSFGGLIERAKTVAAAAAKENVPLRTPITDLFTEQTFGWGEEETLGWYYRRAYQIARPDLDALQYFVMRFENGSVIIDSRDIQRGEGGLRINHDSVADIFDCVKNAFPHSYEDWADDPHPVGGFPMLMRIDDPTDHRCGGLLFDPDTHPCRGTIYFGNSTQECEQLAAFCKLESLVQALFASQIPTFEQCAATEQRAVAINQKASYSFMPSSGICYTCGSDVTIALAGIKKGDMITGCPVCGRSWCD